MKKQKLAAPTAAQTEPMRFSGPVLTVGKRATWERTKTWLLNLRTGLQEKKRQLDELNGVLEQAESRKAQFESAAAENPDAALKLSGAEAQLAKLAPKIKELAQALERDTQNAARQSHLVRTTELKDLLFGPFTDGLIAEIASALSRFLGKSWAHQTARGLAERSEPYRQIMFFLNRPPVSAELEDVTGELGLLADEITKILAGEVILEVPAS
ncbi:MAG TPA: hypothetical protein VGG02_00555 [Chthoniobacterales bacterium]|jgi:DNA repair exonuclease SbcCD ATPase subunit